MPRLLNGVACQGVGLTGVTVANQLLVPQAGTPAWASPCQIVYNGAANAVMSVDPATRLTAAFPFMPPGADVVCAGAGTVAASLDSKTLRLRNAGGFSTILNQCALDVDRTQGIAISYNKQVGQNICVFFAGYHGDGSGIPIIVTGPILTARCLNAIVCWNELVGSTWTAKGHNLTNNLPITIQTLGGNCYQPLLFNAGSNTWVLYSDQAGDGHLHPVNAPSSTYTFPGPVFGLDAEFQPSGKWLIAWATNQGESAGSLKTETLSL